MKSMTIRSFGLARALATLGGVGCALHASSSRAQATTASAEPSTSANVARTSAGPDSGAILLAGKFGGLASVGIGPRVYFLESVARGNAGGHSFQDTPERSTKLGFGVPLGAEFQIGPGGLFGELFPHWAALKHATTGNSHLGGMSVLVGYRAAL